MAATLLISAFCRSSFSQDNVKFGFWTQLWYQYVEDGKDGDTGLSDFIARRAYFSISGQPSDLLSFFTHIAVDRLGQEGLDNAALGLGSGLVFRDLWATPACAKVSQHSGGSYVCPSDTQLWRNVHQGAVDNGSFSFAGGHPGQYLLHQ
jgi:hypothetical protein